MSKERRVKVFLAQQPVRLVTTFSLSWTQTGKIHVKHNRRYQPRLNVQTLTVTHLHFDFSSFLHLKRSHLDQNVCSALGYVNLQGWGGGGGGHTV